MKRASRDWCHFLPGMLSGRLLLLMECFVRARNPEVHSRPSRERPLYMGGPFFLRMHYISLVKFTLRTTEAGQTIESINCTRWPIQEECGKEFDPELWYKLKSRYSAHICEPLNINIIHLTTEGNDEKVRFIQWYSFIIAPIKHEWIL